MLTIVISVITLGLLYWSFQHKEGYFLCFILLFETLLSLLLYNLGVTGVKLLFWAGLNMLVLGKYFLEDTLSFRTDMLVKAVCILFVAIFLYNYFLRDTWVNLRISDVNNFQLSLFTRVISPFLMTVATVNSRKRLYQLIEAIPLWGIVFLLIVVMTVDYKAVDLSDRMTITEESDGKISTIALSRYAAMIFIAAFIILMEGRKRIFREKLLFAFALVLSSLFVFLSGQRGTIVGLILGISLYFYCTLNKENIKRLLLYGTLFFLAVFIVFEFNLFSLADRFTDLKNFRDYERFNDYRVSWNIFKNNNYLWGEGSRGYYFLTGRTYPHNMVLEYMVEYGLAGLVLALVIVIGGGIYSVRIFRNILVPRIYKAIPIIWITLCFSMLISSNITGGYLFFTFTALLANVHKEMMLAEYISARRRNYLNLMKKKYVE